MLTCCHLHVFWGLPAHAASSSGASRTQKPIGKAYFWRFFQIFGGLVPGFVCWVLGIVCWVLGFVCWVLGFVFWVSGFVFWVSGFVFWVSAIAFRVPRWFGLEAAFRVP